MSMGTIVQVIGAVVDAEFPNDAIPKVYDALHICLLYTSPSPRDRG